MHKKEQQGKSKGIYIYIYTVYKTLTYFIQNCSRSVLHYSNIIIVTSTGTLLFMKNRKHTKDPALTVLLTTVTERSGSTKQA